MTTDDGLHLLGTQPVHLVVPLAVAVVGWLLDSQTTMAFATGMLTVLLFGNMRTVRTYRWRVDESEKADK